MSHWLIIRRAQSEMLITKWEDHSSGHTESQLKRLNWRRIERFNQFKERTQDVAVRWTSQSNWPLELALHLPFLKMTNWITGNRRRGHLIAARAGRANRVYECFDRMQIVHHSAFLGAANYLFPLGLQLAESIDRHSFALLLLAFFKCTQSINYASIGDRNDETMAVGVCVCKDTMSIDGSAARSAHQAHPP